MKMTLNRWLWVAIVVALLYAHLLIGTLVAIATAFYWLLENRQGQPSTSKQSSEEPETFLLKLTTSDAAKNSGWEFWEVFPTLKQMTHERALGDPRTHRERYDYEIRGTNVFVRLLTSSREGCDDTTYDVFNGSINYPQIEAEHQREKERWNGNPIFTLEETIARLQKRIGWHEIYGAIRYFLISKQSNVDEQYDCQRFCKHEYDRITEACSTMEKKAVELGATATFYGYRAPKDASPEIKEAIKQNLSISKFGFHTFGEFEEKEASLKILQEVTR